MKSLSHTLWRCLPRKRHIAIASRPPYNQIITSLRLRFAGLKGYLIGSEFMYQRLARSSFWSIVGTATGQVFSLTLSIIIARMLGKTGLGEFGLIRSTIITLGVLSGTGLGIAATKYVPDYRVSSPERTGNVIGLLLNVGLLAGCVITVATFVWADPLATRLMKAGHLIGPLQVGGVLVTVNSVGGVQRGVLAGLDEFKVLTWLATIEGFLILFACSVGTHTSGLSGTIAGYALASVAALMLRHAVLIKACRRNGIVVRHRRVWTESKILWSFVVPSVLVGASVLPFEWCASLILVRRPDGFGELGVFSAAYSWGMLVTFLPNQVCVPGLAILSKLFAERNVRSFIRMGKTIVLTSLALGGLMAILLACLSPFIMKVYGDTFAGRWDVLVLLSIAHAFASGNALRAVFTACNRMWIQLCQCGVWGLALVGGALALVNYGGEGLAVAYVAAYCVQMIMHALTGWYVLRTDLAMQTGA